MRRTIARVELVDLDDTALVEVTALDHAIDDGSFLQLTIPRTRDMER